MGGSASIHTSIHDARKTRARTLTFAAIENAPTKKRSNRVKRLPSLFSFRTREVPRVALIAHDRHKPELVEFVSKNLSFFRACKLCGTASTMKICGGLEGLTFESMDDLAKDLAPEYTGKSPIKGFCSGPIGGDIQLGFLILVGKMDGVFFFQDKDLSLQTQPHKADVLFFDRICKMYQDENDYEKFLASSSKGAEGEQLISFLVNEFPAVNFGKKRARTMSELKPEADLDNAMVLYKSVTVIQRSYRNTLRRRIEVARKKSHKARADFKTKQRQLYKLKLDLMDQQNPSGKKELGAMRKEVRKLREKYELTQVEYLIMRAKFNGREAQAKKERGAFFVDMGVRMSESGGSEQTFKEELEELQWQERQLILKQIEVKIPDIQECTVRYASGSEVYFYVSTDLVEEVVTQSKMGEHPNVSELILGEARSVDAGVVAFIGVHACALDLAGVFLSHQTDWGQYTDDIETMQRICQLYDLPIAMNEMTRMLLTKRITLEEVSRTDYELFRPRRTALDDTQTMAEKSLVALVIDGNDETLGKLNQYEAFQMLKIWLSGHCVKSLTSVGGGKVADTEQVSLDELLAVETRDFPCQEFNALMVFLGTQASKSTKFDFLAPMRQMLTTLADEHPELQNPNHIPYHRVILYDLAGGTIKNFEHIRDLTTQHRKRLAGVFLFEDPMVARTVKWKAETKELMDYCCEKNLLLIRSMGQTAYLFDGHPNRVEKRRFIEHYREMRKLQLMLISQKITNKKTKGFSADKTASNILRSEPHNHK